MNNFEKLYEQTMGIYKISDITTDTKFMDKLKKKRKKLVNTKPGKKDSVKSIDLNVIEIEEGKFTELRDTVDLEQMAKVAKLMIKDDSTLKKEIPSPLEIEQYSNKNKHNLSAIEVDYIQHNWEDYV